MEAKELRIGNYIQYETHERITDDFRGKILLVNADLIADIELTISVSVDPIYCGIKITPEILEKAGFINAEEESLGYLSFTDGIHNIWFHKDGGVVFEPFTTNDEDVKIHIFYLHQLQNLYFALTKKELNIHLNIEG